MHDETQSDSADEAKNALDLMAKGNITLTESEKLGLRYVRELVIRSKEVLAAFAKERLVPAHIFWPLIDVYEMWKLGPQWDALGTRSNDGDGAKWAWRFHGNECDFYNVADGRSIRVDGISEQNDSFTSYGLTQFVSKPPWNNFAPEILRVFGQESETLLDEMADTLIKELLGKRLIKERSAGSYEITKLGWMVAQELV